MPTVGRVHDVVSMLTGNNGGPDFLNALVNHSDYNVLDVTEAVNATYSGGGYIPMQDEFLNFIALREDHDGDILLLVSYDGDIDGYGSPFIYFPNEYACDWGAVECRGGWAPTQINNLMDQAISTFVFIYTDEFARVQMVPTSSLINLEEYANVQQDDESMLLSKPRLAVYLEGMPAHTVTLLRIPAGSSNNNSITEEEAQAELQVMRSAGSVQFILSGELENCDLSLYDLSGRKVEEIEISEGEESEIHLNSSLFNAGMYFAVLSKDTDILQIEKISIF